MPKNTTRYIKWFEEVNQQDLLLVGGKGSNLGEMIQAGFPVPKGFIITSTTYFDFIKATGIQDKIEITLKNLDVENTQDLVRAAETCQQLFLNATPSQDIQKEIGDAYDKLSAKKPALVAIRSSATAEDLPEASFAGQQESYMNIKGKQNILRTVKLAWASLFEERAIYYRTQKEFDHLKVGIAVPVQLMVQSDVSGVMFTAEPISNNLNLISIEGGYGSGDATAGGSITPDQYLVDKTSLAIKDRQIVTQEKMLVCSDKAPKKSEQYGENTNLYWLKVPKSYQGKQKLADENIISLAKIGKKIEEHYQHPQDIEWAMEKDKIYVLQTRPITTIELTQNSTSSPQNDIKKQKLLNSYAILTGLGASPGVSSGPVVIIDSPKDIDKVKDGDILVAEKTSPDYVPAMRKAVAVVTNLGGRTSHAAIVSRELGIPAVVGTGLATKMLKNGEVITVNGRTGEIYEGTVIPQENSFHVSQKPLAVKTATKIYLQFNHHEIEYQEEYAKADGVGRLSFNTIFSKLNRHPKSILEEGPDELIDEIYNNLTLVAKQFEGQPVIYHMSNLHSKELLSLKNGSKYEAIENNPFLGLKGAARYLENTDVFKLELEAIKKARRYNQNIWVSLPFVRTPHEMNEIKKIMATLRLYRSGTFKIFLNIDVPSSLIFLNRHIGIGIDGVTIDINTLTQLMLGMDPNNQKLSHLVVQGYGAVEWAVRRTIKICKKHGILANIYGDISAENPKLVEKLVEWGISSITVPSTFIDQTRDRVAKAEFNNLRKLRFDNPD